MPKYTRWHEESVTLFGGYHCVLTPDEMNEWHEFLEASPCGPAFRRVSEMEIALAAQSVVTDKEAGTFAAEMAACEREAYELAKQWHADLLARREKAETED